MPDHIHMLLRIPPKIAVSNFMGYLKGKSSLMIFERHANLKYKYGNRKFWAKGFFVSTVGLDTKKVQEYIRDQEKEDMMQDNLSNKEYKDPFKDSQSDNRGCQTTITLEGWWSNSPYRVQSGPRGLHMDTILLTKFFGGNVKYLDIIKTIIVIFLKK